ncbi:MAG: Hsp20/alpha crystallin family protein [Lachnospiraceae bacterium]|nr:Hsp20/alpha crystallin family protein [Lachnospiraceae bacterium]
MLVPSSLFTDSFMNDWFTDTFNRTPDLFHATGSTQMSTDVKEFKDHFEMAVELPGFKKEDVRASLKDGYLTVNAHREEKSPEGEEAENEGRFVRRERFYGTIERSFYVGEDVKQEDIRAKFENGVLIISIPKIEEKPEVEEDQSITID